MIIIIIDSWATALQPRVSIPYYQFTDRCNENIFRSILHECFLVSNSNDTTPISIYLSIYISIYLFIYLSIYLYIYIYLYICCIILFQECMTQSNYYRRNSYSIGYRSARCVPKDTCTKLANNNNKVCRYYIPSPNCTYCCTGPFCNHMLSDKGLRE